MTSPAFDFSSALPQSTKVLLVMDVVESVRLMEENADGFVRRWQHFVAHVEQQLLPKHGGRLVKSLGDGLMIEFTNPQGCVKTAFAAHLFSDQANQGVAHEQQLHLRAGAHIASFVTDHNDIYGKDVNLAVRLTTLAGPGELVTSAELRDELTEGLDGDIEDLGDCHLKHVPEPVRAYRVGPAGAAPVVRSLSEVAVELRPTVAVIPFEARSNEPEHFAIGELIAEGIIAQLARTSDLRVISRLSTTAFRGRDSAMTEIQDRLDASYVLCGSYVVSGSKILITAELADTRNNHIAWAERSSGDVGDLLQAQSELLNQIAGAAHRALLDTEVQQALIQPLPRLDSCALLLSGVSLMHRSTADGFKRSREALEALVERHQRSAIPRAWLAKWHIMRVVRGMSDSPERDAKLAFEQTQRALDVRPLSPLALAIQGHALCQLSGDTDAAIHQIDESLRLNPNESLAWLYKSVWSSMWGAADAAVLEAETAATLSPVDPMKYYYDLMLASAHSINRDYEKCIEFAKRSLKANKHHQPTLRALLLAQGESGRMEDAKETLARLVQESPNFTIASYQAMGGANSGARQRLVVLLRQLGARES
ncbi:MAG TPA: adenylate/guanylate cyclase domain-containing protein [Burkholderiaceae bacterium]|nr:adenylate/guanylate cyclase domain-containing protein [Burkholderiaceae bacterium]